MRESPLDELSSELLVACELHSLTRLRTALEAGLDVRAPIKGLSPVNTLLEMYTRSDEFPSCLALLLAVLPANINQAVHNLQPPGLEMSPTMLWVRLPMQLIFIAWAYYVGKRAEDGQNR